MESEPVIVPGIVLSNQVLHDRRTGLHSLIDVFDILNFSFFPSEAKPFWATCWVSNLHGGVGELEGGCRIESAVSGQMIADNFISIKSNRKFEREVWFPITEHFQDLTFYEPGTHTVVMTINGEDIGRRDFMVRMR